MAEHVVKIISTEPVTHNVKRFKVERPDGYNFIPGQATEVSINSGKWKDERRPFTFTGLAHWDHLEFTIKLYSDHDGVTNQLGKLNVGDELILRDVWGAIQYRGEGTFIAGGAGVTPFIAILRKLNEDGKLGRNTLIFSNKSEKDIILKNEFKKMLGKNFINTLTREPAPPYDNRSIDKGYLKEKIREFSQYFYVCGPDPMVEAIPKYLAELGAEKKKIVTEEF